MTATTELIKQVCKLNLERMDPESSHEDLAFAVGLVNFPALIAALERLQKIEQTGDRP